MTPATQPLSADDHVALAELTTTWMRPPLWWSPNDLCRDLEERGLIELRGGPGTWQVRLTEIGEIRRDAAGEA